MKKFFIMVRDPDGDGISPIIEEEDKVMLFDTYESANDLALDHAACIAFGYEIYCWG